MNIIESKNLTHYYGECKIFEDFSFSIKQGKIIGLLGKNGVGKSTTINILMGFLEPTSGECLVYGEPSHALSSATKARIGLLHEGHIQYDFMSVAQVEKYYSKFYPNKWKKELYYELVDKLGVPYTRAIKKLSCGQRSQVVLGLIFAQDADLLILDDYSMGLDVGYRSLFLEYLREYVTAYNKTVLVTTHIMQDLEEVIDDIILLDSVQPILQMPIKEFLSSFSRYKLTGLLPMKPDKKIIMGIENLGGYSYLYSFENKKTVKQFLQNNNNDYTNIEELSMTFEEAFMGYTGRY